MAIAPGSRYVAFATIEGDALHRADAVPLRSRRDDGAKFAAFLEALHGVIAEDAPTLIAVEHLGRRRDTAVARAQVLRALDEATSRGLAVRVVHLRVTGARVASVATPYPALRHAADAVTSGRDARRSRCLIRAVAIAAAAAGLSFAPPALCSPSDPPAASPA